MVKVVYFNQWFSSISEVITDIIVKNKKDIKVIASSKNKNHAYKKVVDIFIEETWEETKDTKQSMNNYVNYILDICKTYKVDIFFVKKNAKYIMERVSDFASIGTWLVSEPLETLKALEHKSNMYRILSTDENLHYHIPFYVNTSKVVDLINNLELFSMTRPMCLKLDKDEGGLSYRKIVDKKPSIKDLGYYARNTITKSDALEIIKGAVYSQEVDKLLLMEYLDGPEISVDCYNSKKGYIAICRKKATDGSRTQVVYYNKQIANLCKQITTKLNLLYPHNIQFRVKHKENPNDINNLRVIDINPRLSGGTYLEVKAGLNIADIALKDVMNNNEYNIDKFIEFTPVEVAHVERAILL